MLRQQPSGPGMAVHHLENAGRQAGLAIDLLELDGGKRREARGLEDHRVAEGERGSRLPAGDLQRVVPGADAGDDADGLPARVAEGLWAEVDVFARRALRERGEILEALGARDDVDDPGFLDRLAGVAGLERRQRVVALAQEFGCTAQDPGAFRPRERGPGGLRLSREADHGLDFLGAGHRDVAEALAGRGIEGDQAIAGRGHEAPARFAARAAVPGVPGSAKLSEGCHKVLFCELLRGHEHADEFPCGTIIR